MKDSTVGLIAQSRPTLICDGFVCEHEEDVVLRKDFSIGARFAYVIASLKSSKDTIAIESNILTC